MGAREHVCRSGEHHAGPASEQGSVLWDRYAWLPLVRQLEESATGGTRRLSPAAGGAWGSAEARVCASVVLWAPGSWGEWGSELGWLGL